ncbi:hypothetical protein BH11PAT1_BH11PAT1_3500 [soil metagenome]
MSVVERLHAANALQSGSSYPNFLDIPQYQPVDVVPKQNTEEIQGNFSPPMKVINVSRQHHYTTAGELRWKLISMYPKFWINSKMKVLGLTTGEEWAEMEWNYRRSQARLLKKFGEVLIYSCKAKLKDRE